MKLKKILFFGLLILFLASCASGAKGYKRKKKKGCDCPSWSLELKEANETKQLNV